MLQIGGFNPSTREVVAIVDGCEYRCLASAPCSGIVTIYCHIFIITGKEWKIRLGDDIDLKTGKTYRKEEKIPKITNGILGPVQTQDGKNPCRFTGKIGDEQVEGTYNPKSEKMDVVGSVAVDLTIKGVSYHAKFGPIWANGLCGEATPI